MYVHIFVLSTVLSKDIFKDQQNVEHHYHRFLSGSPEFTPYQLTPLIPINLNN